MPKLSNEQAKEILKCNAGFRTIEPWVDYAISHDFKMVRSHLLESCPDCDAELGPVLGQFVYYSCLHRLRECSHCNLIYTDVRINADVISGHFETTYKDERYFLKSRAGIFNELLELADRFSPRGATLLDIGGATGLLASKIAEKRPDLDVHLTDLSETACEMARETYQLTAFQSSIADLVRHEVRYDLVLLIDVIYYEENIQALWSAVCKLLKPGGRIIIRVPNKLPLIRFLQRIRQIVGSAESAAQQSRIKFFNPEHQYIFSPRYLSARLQGLGFSDLALLPSAVLRKSSIPEFIFSGIDRGMQLLWKCSGRRAVATPSFLITARFDNQN